MKVHFLFIAFVLLASCVSTEKTIRKSLDSMEKEFHHNAGFVLYDPASGEYIIDYQGDQYFTPASNTKILTFYTSLRLLPDSLVGLEYVRRQDSLIVWGTGDPSLFYEELPVSNVAHFLTESADTIYLARRNYVNEAFGPGWSWADYLYPYSSERSDFPVYGNTFTMKHDSLTGFLKTPQPYFRRFIWLGDTLEYDKMHRDVHSNRTTFNPGKSRENSTFTIPFIYSPEIAARLLSDTLGKTVIPVENVMKPDVVSQVKSIPRDSALTVMMQQSDNFIAEQLLLMSAYSLSDTLESDIAIEYARENFFAEMPQEPLWYDGSGLSRYNLITPKSVVWLWDKILKEYTAGYILPMLASGGGPGTLENWYVSNPPFIYGKTGTLRNNHNVSGVIYTSSGKMYLFSFMNNNFPTSSSPVKQKMEQILRLINEKL